MAGAEATAGDEVVEHSNEGRLLFASYRDILGVTVLLGDCIVGVGAAIALRDHAPIAALAPSARPGARAGEVRVRATTSAACSTRTAFRP